MIHYSRLVLVGVILLVFGVTLGGISFAKLYDTVENIIPTSGLLLVSSGNSSTSFLCRYLTPSRVETQFLDHVTKVRVVVTEIRDLQVLLNPTFNLNCTLPKTQNITIRLDSDFGEYMVASENAWGTQTDGNAVAYHEFDIPSNWTVVNLGIRIYNPENYSACWIVNLMIYGQVIDSNMQTTMYIGIVSAAIGGIIIGTSVLFRKLPSREVEK